MVRSNAPSIQLELFSTARSVEDESKLRVEHARLRMLVGILIEILNDGEILVNCKAEITIWICTGRYRRIRIQSKSQFEFVQQDTEEFEFLDFD